MQAKDDKYVALRQAVANRLKRTFDAWTAELAAGTSSIWDGVQRRLSEKAPEVPPAAPLTGVPQTVADSREQGRRYSMARSQKSDRDFSADAPAADGENLAGLLDQSEVLDAFDAAIRLRFGQTISAAVARTTKRR